MFSTAKVFSAKRRRGIATVVTSAIILSAVSIMGAMMLSWSNTSMAEQRMEIEEVFSTQMNTNICSLDT